MLKDNFTFQIGILAPFATNLQSFNACAARKPYADAVFLRLNLHMLEGIKDFAITA